MTIELFRAWLRDLDIKMMKENRKLLLFIDNCPANPKKVKLQNVRVEFSPPNATSKVQPLDQDVIEVVKQYNRRCSILRLVAQIHKPEENFSVTLLDAIHFLTP